MSTIDSCDETTITTPGRSPKTWLLTGSSRGFGRSLAETILAAGDNLVATARNPAAVAELADAYGNRVLPFTLDVTDSQQARAAVAAAVDRDGRLDVVVKQRRLRQPQLDREHREDDLRAQVETDLWGVVNVTRAALPVMHRQRGGHPRSGRAR